MDWVILIIAAAVFTAATLASYLLHAFNRCVRRSTYPTLLSDTEQRFSWAAFDSILRTAELRFAALGVGMLCYAPGCLCYKPGRRWKIMRPILDEDEDCLLYTSPSPRD